MHASPQGIISFRFNGETMKYEDTVYIRIPIKYRKQIETLIKAGKFRSLSQVVREALKQFLEKQGE